MGLVIPARQVNRAQS